MQDSKAKYHCADVETNSGVKEREHSEKIKKLPKPVHIPTEDLLPISSCYFPFK